MSAVLIHSVKVFRFCSSSADGELKYISGTINTRFLLLNTAITDQTPSAKHICISRKFVIFQLSQRTMFSFDNLNTNHEIYLKQNCFSNFQKKSGNFS